MKIPSCEKLFDVANFMSEKMIRQQQITDERITRSENVYVGKKF